MASSGATPPTPDKSGDQPIKIDLSKYQKAPKETPENAVPEVPAYEPMPIKKETKEWHDDRVKKESIYA